MENDDHIVIDNNTDAADNICEECRKEDESCLLYTSDAADE